MTETELSVRVFDGTLYAVGLMSESDLLRRLQADDPVWHRPDVVRSEAIDRNKYAVRDSDLLFAFISDER